MMRCYLSTFQDPNEIQLSEPVKIVAINVHSVFKEKNIVTIERVAKDISNVISRRLLETPNEAIAIIGTTDYTHAGI